MLKQRGTYVLNFENGDKVTFTFNTMAFLRFCELSGDISFSQMLDLFSNNLSIKHVANLLIAASGGDYTLNDAAEWMDEMGGIAGKELAECINTATNALVDKGAKEDKKKAGKS